MSQVSCYSSFLLLSRFACKFLLYYLGESHGVDFYRLTAFPGTARDLLGKSGRCGMPKDFRRDTVMQWTPLPALPQLTPQRAAGQATQLGEGYSHCLLPTVVQN